MSDCIAQEHDGIIIQTYNKATLTLAIEEAEETGIPAVCINTCSDAICHFPSTTRSSTRTADTRTWGTSHGCTP